MIAKSDVIILVVSATVLAAGIYRWQSNMNMLSTAQNTVSSPTATVLNPAQSTSSAANATQPAVNASQINTATANTGNAVAITTTNSTVASGNAVNNGTQPTVETTATDATANLVVGSTSQSSSGNQSTETLYGIYRVQSGDYLGKIAQTYGTTVETLRSINNISGSLIEIDQEIRYPLPAN